MVVSFSAYTPPERYDALAWNRARIEQSAAETGPFTIIETKTFSPVDADPANPVERSFTTELATLTNGWFRVVWLDASNDESLPTDAVQNVASILSDIRPSVAEVSALLRARTVDTNGVELGTFTTATRPTLVQVRQLIDMATELVLARVGEGIPSHLFKRAQIIVALRAAMLIELSFYPEQIDGDQSAYSAYAAMFLEMVAALADAVKENLAGDLSAGFANVPITGANGVVSTYALPTDLLV